jgi:hypothetical protein
MEYINLAMKVGDPNRLIAVSMLNSVPIKEIEAALDSTDNTKKFAIEKPPQPATTTSTNSIAAYVNPAHEAFLKRRDEYIAEEARLTYLEHIAIMKLSPEIVIGMINLGELKPFVTNDLLGIKSFDGPQDVKLSDTKAKWSPVRFIRYEIIDGRKMILVLVYRQLYAQPSYYVLSNEFIHIELCQVVGRSEACELPELPHLSYPTGIILLDINTVRYTQQRATKLYHSMYAKYLGVTIRSRQTVYMARRRLERRTKKNVAQLAPQEVYNMLADTRPQRKRKCIDTDDTPISDVL